MTRIGGWVSIFGDGPLPEITVEAYAGTPPVLLGATAVSSHGRWQIETRPSDVSSVEMLRYVVDDGRYVVDRPLDPSVDLSATGDFELPLATTFSIEFTFSTAGPGDHQPMDGLVVRILNDGEGFHEEAVGGRTQWTHAHLWPGQRPDLDLTVELLTRAGQRGTVAHRMDIAPTAEVDFRRLVIDLPANLRQRDSEFKTAQNRVMTERPGIQLTSLQPKHQPELAGVLGNDELAADLIDAYVLSVEDGGQLPAGGFFALLRRNVIDSLDALDALDTDQLTDAFTAAIDEGTVSLNEIGPRGQKIATVADRFERSRRRRLINSRGLVIPAALARVSSEADLAELGGLLHQYGEGAVLWQALDDSDPLKDRSSDIRRAFELWEITEGHEEATIELFGSRGVGRLESPLDERLVGWSRITWQDQLSQQTTRDFSIDDVMDRLAKRHPDGAFVRLLDEPELGNDLAAIRALRDLRPGFALTTSPVAGLFDQEPELPKLLGEIRRRIRDDAPVDDAATRRAVLDQERALRLVTDTPLARQIALVRRILERPVAIVGGRLPDPDDEDEVVVYRRARQANAVALTVGAQLTSSLDTHLAALPRRDRLAAEELSNWQDLFGQPAVAECDHCASVYSPAAYLVELLSFLRERIDPGGRTSLLDLLTGSDSAPRRPDLVEVELTCANTEHLVPYVDLVNEILEREVAGKTGATTSWPQTKTADADALRLKPDHQDPDAYVLLKAAVALFNRPFDLWAAETDAYLERLGTNRAVISAAVATVDPIEAGDLDHACLVLGITPSDMVTLRPAPALAEAAAALATEPDRQDPQARRVPIVTLLDVTRSTVDELQPLLATDHVGVGALRPVSADELVRLDTLIRLRRHVPWTVDQLDRAIGQFGVGLADDEAIERLIVGLAQVTWLVERLSIDVPAALDLIGPVDDRALTNLVRPALLAAAGLTPLERNAPVPAAEAARVFALIFGWSESDAAELLAVEGITDLDWDDLGLLHRLITLDRASGWSARQRQIAGKLFDINPAADVGSLVRYLKLVDELDAANVDIEASAAVVQGDLALGQAQDRHDRVATAIATVADGGGDTDSRRVDLVDALAAAATVSAASTATVLALLRLPSHSGVDIAELLLKAPVMEGSTETELAIARAAATVRLASALGVVRLLDLAPAAIPLLFDRVDEVGWLAVDLLPITGPADDPQPATPPVVSVSADRAVDLDQAGSPISVGIEAWIDGSPRLPVGATLVWSVEGPADANIEAPDQLTTTIQLSAHGAYQCTATITTTEGSVASETATIWVRTPHVTRGLIARYELDDSASADQASDTAPTGAPVDLRPVGGNHTFTGRSLILNGPGHLASGDRQTPGAERLIEAITTTRELSVDLWLSPATLASPLVPTSRIVSISVDPGSRNLTIGQNGRTIEVRLRTTETNENGTEDKDGVLKTLVADDVLNDDDVDGDGSPVHLAYTFADGVGTLYRDGVELTRQEHGGNIAPKTSRRPLGWDPSFPLLFGDELSGERAWPGELHRVTIHDRALTPEEIATNHRAGAEPGAALPAAPTVDAGPSRRAQLDAVKPTRRVRLAATADGLEELSPRRTVRWEQLSGPAPVSISNRAALTPQVTCWAAGTYELQLTLSGPGGELATSTATIWIERDSNLEAKLAPRWRAMLVDAGFAKTSVRLANAPTAAPAGYAVRLALLEAGRQQEDAVPLVAALTGWEVDALRALVDTIGWDLPALANGVALLANTGLPAATLDDLAAHDVGLAQAALARETALAAATGNEDTDGLIELRDRLRNASRQALVSYLLAERPEFRTADDLYAHFLIDVEMDACMTTSRLKQALSSVQLFVHRALMNLEDGVALRPTDATQWEWMKAYRLWEANRRVFLHPENWIEPDLRSDKSPFFAELEADLAQGEITSDLAERAVARYLAKLADVADLQVAALTREFETGTAAGPTRTLDQPTIGGSVPVRSEVFTESWLRQRTVEVEVVLDDDPGVTHLFAHTRGEPKRWFHRQWINQARWTPWEELSASISGPHVVPVFHLGRLHLLWTTFETKQERPDVPEKDAEPSEPVEYLQIELNSMTFDDGAWSAPRRADGAAIIRPLVSVVTHNIAFKFTLQAWSGVEPPAPERFNLLVTTQGDALQVELLLPLAGGASQFRWPGFVRDLRRDAFTAMSSQPGFTHDAPLRDNVGTALTGDIPLSWPAVVGRANRRRYPVLFHRAVIGPSRPVLGESPAPPYRLIGDTRRDIVAAGLPLIYQDGASILAFRQVGRSGDTVGVDYLHHGQAERFLMTANRVGVPGVLKPPADSPLRHQALVDTPSFKDRYRPNADIVVGKAPDDGIDFSLGSANELYNWEVFFHIPLLVAKRLMAAERFDEARKWLHYIFDPTNAAPAPAADDGPANGYWELKPFRELTDKRTVRELLSLLGSADDPTPEMERSREILERQIGEWLANPFDPHAVARLRLPAYQKAVVMAYLDNLLAWGDHLFRQDSIESINEATQLYILAGQVMGRRPHRLPADEVAPLTFAQIDSGAAATQNRLREIEDRVASREPITEPAVDTEPVTISPYFCLPQNPKLTGYWDTIADRLHKIRHCQNIEGVVRTLALFEPPIDPGALVTAGADGSIGGASMAQAPPAPYRYATIAAAARAATNELTLRFSQPFLNALEQRDSAALAELIAFQDRDLTTTTRPLRKLERELADLDLSALQYSRDIVQGRRDHYADRTARNAGETAGLILRGLGLISDGATVVVEGLATALAPIPEIEGGIQGAFSSPVFTIGTSGEAAATVMGHAAATLQAVTSVLDRSADIALTEAGFVRRDEEWQLEIEQADAELDRIDVEIEAARARIEVADYWTGTLEDEIKYAVQRDEYLRNRFTNAELHEWMVGRLGSLHARSFDEVYQLATMAERAFQHELGVTDTYIQSGHWDGLRQGLTAANALLLDLQRLDRAYLAGNTRSLELTKRVTLTDAQLNRLRQTGTVTLPLAESDFDRDHPGHYHRRIRSAALSVRARGGVKIDASLTLRKSSIRTEPRIDAEPVIDQRADSIATSGRPEDRGLHEFNWSDERLLPFEGRGAAGSEWLIDVYKEVNNDLDSITGVELRIDYTARAGGSQFRDEVAKNLNT